MLSDIIVLVFSTMFQTCDIKLCNYIHVSFYQPKEINKIRIKYKSSSIL